MRFPRPIAALNKALSRVSTTAIVRTPGSDCGEGPVGALTKQKGFAHVSRTSREAKQPAR